ncbi:DEAD/DEAH box helicase [Neisseria dentiae]
MTDYFQTEPCYRDLYQTVEPYGKWVEKYAETLDLGSKTDAGIDLVATTFNGEHHAVQCKNYAEDYTVKKQDIDSFFTASGKHYFSNRIIVSTTDHWSKNAEDALTDQQIPVSKITLNALENSVIDWSKYHIDNQPAVKIQKQLRQHQQQALQAVDKGFARGETRGKLIMACGTGKTFTSLRIAEHLAGKGKRVLFLVPSLSLLSQTLREWTQDSILKLRNFAVCSDSEVGKKKVDDDRTHLRPSDLEFPATTHAKSLFQAATALHDAEHMTVVYSTYHSIDVIHQAQKQYGLPEFDLIICDEAHRTTGATFDGDDESAFVRIHDADYIQGAKRLYMTATPRIYGETAKAAEGVVLYSMDNEAHYGKEFFVLTFSQAVSDGLLVDYKVIVLAIEESHIQRRIQNLLTDGNNELKVDDAAKIVGCWKALSKYGLTGEEGSLYHPMRRAVAFCQVIEKEYKGSKHKVSSKLIAEMFQAVIEEYQQAERKALLEHNSELKLPPQLAMICEAAHVDGGMNAGEKESKLQWLKAELPDNTCRILSNVRCLSEGVDVPALDAVLFLTPRNSQVDVVQSVGRVMRRAEGKKQGYVILPVVIPAGVEAEDALDKNENYKVVWQVLNALRAHDDRFDAMINKLEFNGKDTHKMEVIAIADKVTPKVKRTGKKDQTLRDAQAGYSIGSNDAPIPPIQKEIQFEIGEIERTLYAKIVKKCGNRHHWEDWAGDIAKIARTHIDSITAILENPDNTAEQNAFAEFSAELRDDLNNAVTDAEIIEMLAQHMITKPVFDALFEQYSFAEHNPMSRAMQNVLDLLQAKNLHKERNTLQSFYDSVHLRASGIETAEGKQKIVVELYDKFFRNAFPRMTERLGIVYTPVEVVDFIIRSVEDVLKNEFHSSLKDQGVHIIDPFTGTGTFITRLLQSGIIPTDKLPEKYQNEIHANEIVLLAYYIAAINIEATYHGILHNNINGKVSDGSDYVPFNGICLTDTFQMYEKGDMLNELLVDNSARRKRQKSLDIRVIIGNPPYSAGQESANDNNANIEYLHLDNRIRETYAEYSNATSTKNLMDSYVRSIRWASDRIGKQGVIGFVTNGGFLESSSADGLRKCLVDEFSSLYIFHLRGNARTSGERRRKEKDNVFGQGTRTPIAISILVKNPNATEQGKIYFHDIGDYLSRDEKLAMISEYGSINGISEQNGWQEIQPDEFNDWLNQRDPNFDNYISLGDKKDKDAVTVFDNYSLGLGTNRDAWVYNFSHKDLEKNMEAMIGCYNSEVQRFKEALDRGLSLNINDFIEKDETKISWSSSLVPKVEKGILAKFNPDKIVIGVYRPFSKQFIYYDKMMNHRIGQMPQIFPNITAFNQVISITGRGATKEFSALITDEIPDLEMISKGQCFPMNLYEENGVITQGIDADAMTADATQRNATQRNATQRNANYTRQQSTTVNTEQQHRESDDLPDSNGQQRLLGADDGHTARFALDWRRTMFPNVSLRNGGSIMSQSDLFTQGMPSEKQPAQKKLVRRSAITDDALAHFRQPYSPEDAENISKEDIFYYIYGLLHSEEYRERYADNLSKQLPRIPRMKNYADFADFAQAGRDLAALHLYYETVPMYQGVKFSGSLKGLKLTPQQIIGGEAEDFRVVKMKFAKKDDKTRVVYNGKITVENIPETAYDYIVNGKPALEWVMERQAVTTDKKSGITNDANDWAIETMGNPRYPLELFLRVITVSLETQKIVNALPKLDIV